MDSRQRGWCSKALFCLVILAPISSVADDGGQPANVEDSQDSSTRTSDDSMASDDAVVVTGTRTPQRESDSPISITVITREDIEASGATTVAQMATTLGGVQLNRTFAGTGLSLQGLEEKHTLILVDGDRLSGQKDGITDLERIDLAQVERIEIVRGATSALYGADALGGVVNVITRKSPKDNFAELRGIMGFSESEEGASREIIGRVGAQSGSFSGLLVGGLHLLPAYDLTPADDNLQTHGSAVEDWDVRSQFEWRLSRASKVSFDAEYARRLRTGVDQSAAGAVLDREQRVDSYDARVKHEHRFGSGVRLTGSLRGNHLRDQFLRDQRRSNRQDSYEDTRIVLIQGNAQVDVPLPARHVLTIGVDALTEEADNPRIVKYETCDPESPSKSCRTATRHRGALYLQDQYTILMDPYLVSVAGVRVEGDSRFGWETVPRVAIRFDPIAQVTLRASVGFGYRAPTFKELYLRFDNPSANYTVRGNEALEPERSVSYQLSLDWQTSYLIRLHLGAFRNDVEGLMDYELVSQSADELDRYVLSNIASATTQGVRVEVSFVPFTVFQCRAGATVLDTWNVEEGRPLQGRARFQANGEVVVSPDRTGLRMSTSVLYTGRRPYFFATDDMDARRVNTDPSTYLTANIAWRFTQWTTASLRAENLLNEGDADFLSLRPRRYLVALSGKI